MEWTFVSEVLTASIIRAMKFKWGTPPPKGGGRQGYCMRDIFILNEIWAQGKIYILVGAAWLKYFTYHLVPVLAPSYKQHILSPAKVRKVCYSLRELCVKYVYLNLFGWRGA
jgi:hypothetical protein